VQAWCRAAGTGQPEDRRVREHPVETDPKVPGRPHRHRVEQPGEQADRRVVDGVRRDTDAPQSPPQAPYRRYPSPCINSARAPRHPVDIPPALARGAGEAQPGIDGTITWKSTASGPITSRNSTTGPGQPWESTSGSASGRGQRTWKKSRLRALDPLVDEAQDELLAPLSPAERAELVRGLQRIDDHHSAG
jgi:hypothetical protein